MSLRILLADDSMTAQNMGKKILSDAGYEVTAVSNGAAALKKANELKPDLVVLDIYMPGYTGLEVCERLKNAPDTAHIPVMLTVGKLEPYRAEDGARVRAEGVIIKPFEASDLIAAVQQIATTIVPPAPTPAAPEPPEPPAPFIVTPPPAEAHNPEPAAPAMPAFDSPNPLDVPAFTPSAAAMPAFDIAPMQDFSAPQAVSASGGSPDFELPHLAPTAEPAPASVINLDFLRAPGEPPVVPIPSTEPVMAPEFEATAAPKLGDVQIEVEQALEPTVAAPEPSVNIGLDPALVTDPAEIATFAVKVGTEIPDSATVGIEPPTEFVLPEPEAPVIAHETQSEFPEQTLEPVSSVPASFAPPMESRLDPIELFHEEYGPAADGSIDLSVPDRQAATPPPLPAYANAGAVGYAMTPAMRDYLERLEQERATTKPLPEPEAEVVEPPTPVVAEEPVLDLSAEAHAIEPPSEEPIHIAEESPLDIDALLGPELSEVSAPPALEQAVETVEPLAPEPVIAEPPIVEPVAEEVLLPEVQPEPATPQPEPAVIPEIEETAAPEPAPEPEVASAAPEPLDEPVVTPHVSAAMEQLAQEVLSPVAHSVSDEPAIISEGLVANVSQPESAEVALPQSEPEPVVTENTEAAPEPEAEPADGLSAVDRARIAGAVQRVFDRYKPQIIADITRELMKQND